ncbi:MarR family transcriptional regulator [Proteiniclasticum sp. SCR006]|uniref:MarR family transcriptional regulator n=1 Tax=Proteiniclasticum aestuarii TaxID=2817862 RepID=A0A939H846_9CLOT|nr:MarR family transcriptional regulator [Proteiniclasticum aestuarii]MBO1264891.1 MarR family transcriptional regulator [Proteiniclasticum aestuarii]
MKEEERNQLDEKLSLKLFVVLTRALDSVRKSIEKEIRSYGLNPTEFAVLELLYNRGEQTVQKIGEKVLIASSSITYVVDKLEKKKLILRTPNPEDRRITQVSITEEGKAMMDDIFPGHVKAVQRILEGLDTWEKEEMITQLKKLGIQAKNR